MKHFLLLLVLSTVGLSQTTQTSLLVTRIYGVTSSWPGECAAGVVNNQSQVSRRNNYHSISAAGSGTWTAALNFSDTACTGPWTSFGSGASITQASNPAIAYGNGYHPFIQIVVTGSATVTYAAARDFFLSSSIGSLIFPITVAQGGTGVGSFPLNGPLFGNGTNPIQSSAAGSQYQTYQAGASGVPAFDALHLDQSAATTGILPVPKGGCGAVTYTANGMFYGNGTSPCQVTAAGSQYQVFQAGASGVPAPGPVHLDQGAAVTGALPKANYVPPSWADVTGSKQGNTNLPQMASGAPAVGNFLGYDASGNAVNSGYGPSTVIPAGSVPFQRFRSGLSPVFAGAFVNSQVSYATDFSFAAISPGGSLSGGAGAQSVTLTPCPLGIVVTGSSATPLYFSGGTGTAEALLPSGGTCTSGATSGTVVVTPLNNHTGAWTVTSATAGIQEALTNLGANGGVVLLDPSNTTTLHSGVTFPAANVTVDGVGGASSTVNRASDYPNGNLFGIRDNSSGHWYHIKNIVFQNQTTAGQSSGAAIGIILARVVIDNIRCFGGYICVNADSTPGFTLINFEMHADVHTNALVNFTGAVGAQVVTDDLVSDGQLYCTQGVAIRVGAADGLTISNVQGGGGAPWMLIAPETFPLYISNTRVDGVLIDVPVAGQAAILINGGGNIQISNSKFLNGAAYGIIVSGGAAPIQIGPGNQFDYTINPAIQQNSAGPFPLAITGNLFTGCNKNSSAATPCVLVNVGNAAITGNVFQSDTATWLISSEGATTNFFVEANTFTGASAPYSLDMGAGILPTNAVIRNNGGIDNVIGSVADAATLVFPPNPNFVITGSGTTITQTTMTKVAGASFGTFRTTGGAIPFTATGVIGSAGTTVQNKLYQWFWDGTRLWIYGSGF